MIKADLQVADMRVSQMANGDSVVTLRMVVRQGTRDEREAEEMLRAIEHERGVRLTLPAHPERFRGMPRPVISRDMLAPVAASEDMQKRLNEYMDHMARVKEGSSGEHVPLNKPAISATPAPNPYANRDEYGSW
ncbi:hypothetical protein [Cupriavidus metallidurans]|uniref:hypothetical protein n=1 Tax=Cupriavidus metallidurans TaxID=119219 RepID=UPI001CC98D2E|nr:hypothetical protein [Cupriavidus metallidurans]UBM12709.1 hypothetical protein LAI70_28255 [Cupriavidus metallidurans]